MVQNEQKHAEIECEAFERERALTTIASLANRFAITTDEFAALTNTNAH